MFFTMNTLVSNSHSPLSFCSCFFALGVVAFFFLVGQAKIPTFGRLLVSIGNFTLSIAALLFIVFMHYIVAVIFSWLPNRSQNDHDADGGDEASPHHHDQETWPLAPPQDIVTLFHMVLMEVLDRVWEDLVMEEAPEQRPPAALEALPPPFMYSKGGPEMTSSCYSDRCTICLEDFVDGESCRVFLCKHLYHTICIDPWLKNHVNCPICRKSVLDI